MKQSHRRRNEKADASRAKGAYIFSNAELGDGMKRAADRLAGLPKRAPKKTRKAKATA